jgi:hypothetical protein
VQIADIQAKVSAGDYLFSQHADQERQADNLTIAQVEAALLSGVILESYPDTGRGESAIVVGFGDGQPIHVVCGWRGTRLVIVTVYVPKPPKFVDPWTRGKP